MKKLFNLIFLVFLVSVTHAQNVGINTTTPTAHLDINGTLRVRGTNSTTGSVLTCQDANGSVQWEKPVAFKATGGYDGVANSLSNYTWTKILFNQTASYNLGAGYQPVNSQFLVAEKGIYHFNAQLFWEEMLIGSSIKIRVNRNGNIFTLGERWEKHEVDLAGDVIRVQRPSAIAIDGPLEVGDIVWLEGYAEIAATSGSTTSISASSIYTWFSCHIVTRY